METLSINRIHIFITYAIQSFRVMTGETGENEMTAEQMRKCLFAEMRTNLVDLELNEMLKALDQDNDGKIKVDDFVRLLTSENAIIKEDDVVSCADLHCVIL